MQSPVEVMSLTRAELEAWAAALGEPAFRGRQLFRWLHKCQQFDFQSMTDLSKSFRQRLLSRANVEKLALKQVQHSNNDGTIKLLLGTPDDLRVESVLIPSSDGQHVTQCVSSQVGCRMGCKFCLSATVRPFRNLTVSEILDQVYQAISVLEGVRPRNLVFMGMGEPLDNYAAVVKAVRILLDELGLNFGSRRITISTIGLLDRLADLGRDLPVNLAVSMVTTDDSLRRSLLPATRRYPLSDLVEALQRYPLPRRRRITIAYVVMAGVNDSDEDANKLAQLCRSLRCKVNLIPFNPFAGSEFRRPSPKRLEAMGRALLEAGLHTTIRDSRGLDIGAACGMLDGRSAL